MTRWYISQTLDHVRRIHGESQRQLAAPCLNSLVERRYFAEFHYREAKRLLEKFKDSHLSESFLLEVVWGEEERRQEFNRFMLDAGAHVLACVQSIHALADILANAVYFSLGMNLRMPTRSRDDIGAAKLLQRNPWREDEQEVKELLSAGLNGGSFSHIAGLANRGKHRSIVRPTLSEDWTGKAEERHELKFPAFDYKSERYQEVAVASLLQLEHDRWSMLIVDAGNMINATLSKRQ